MTSLLVRALRGEPVERTPVWMMRQAGRYLPEYRKVRAKYDFLQVCRTPELAVEVALQPMRRFGFDAAILFSDILVPAVAMGLSVRFVPGRGPVIDAPIRHERAVQALRVSPSAESMGYVAEIIAELCRVLNPTPVIGFAGAPFTMAAYAIEGGKSARLSATRRMMHKRPTLFRALLDTFADQLVDYLKLQIRAGATVVQLFDTRAGVLSPADYREFALPALRKVFLGIEGCGARRVAFVLSGSPYLGALAQSGADALCVDWTVDLAWAATHGLPLQGNLDPAALHAPDDEIRRRVHQIRRAGQRAPGHVFNLGHGVGPDAPIRGVEAMVAAVREPLP